MSFLDKLVRNDHALDVRPEAALGALLGGRKHKDRDREREREQTEDQDANAADRLAKVALNGSPADTAAKNIVGENEQSSGGGGGPNVGKILGSVVGGKLGKVISSGGVDANIGGFNVHVDAKPGLDGKKPKLPLHVEADGLGGAVKAEADIDPLAKDKKLKAKVGADVNVGGVELKGDVESDDLLAKDKHINANGSANAKLAGVDLGGEVNATDITSKKNRKVKAKGTADANVAGVDLHGEIDRDEDGKITESGTADTKLAGVDLHGEINRDSDGKVDTKGTADFKKGPLSAHGEISRAGDGKVTANANADYKQGPLAAHGEVHREGDGKVTAKGNADFKQGPLSAHVDGARAKDGKVSANANADYKQGPLAAHGEVHRDGDGNVTANGNADYKKGPLSAHIDGARDKDGKVSANANADYKQGPLAAHGEVHRDGDGNVTAKGNADYKKGPVSGHLDASRDKDGKVDANATGDYKQGPKSAHVEAHGTDLTSDKRKVDAKANAEYKNGPIDAKVNVSGENLTSDERKVGFDATADAKAGSFANGHLEAKSADITHDPRVHAEASGKISKKEGKAETDDLFGVGAPEQKDAQAAGSDKHEAGEATVTKATGAAPAAHAPVHHASKQAHGPVAKAGAASTITPASASTAASTPRAAAAAQGDTDVAASGEIQGSGGLGLTDWARNLDLESADEIAETPSPGNVARAVDAKLVAVTKTPTPTPAGNAPVAAKSSPRLRVQPGASHHSASGGLAASASVIGPQPALANPLFGSAEASVDDAKEPAPSPGTRGGKTSASAAGRRIQGSLSRRLAKNKRRTAAPNQQTRTQAAARSADLQGQLARSAPKLEVPGAKTLAKQAVEPTTGRTKQNLRDSAAKSTSVTPSVATSSAAGPASTSAASMLSTKAAEPAVVDPATLAPTVANEEKTIDNAVDGVKNLKGAKPAQITTVAANQEAKVQKAATSSTNKLAAHKTKTDHREHDRRARAAHKGQQAHAKAGQHGQHRKQAIHTSHQDALARLRESFATYKTQQEAKLTSLLADAKLALQKSFKDSEDRQLKALADGKQTIIDTQTSERAGVEAQVKQAQDAEDKKYTDGIAARDTLKQQVYAQHKQIKDDAVRDARALCQSGRANYFSTGEGLANDAVSRGNSDAQNLLAQGRNAAAAAAQRARAGVADDAPKGAAEHAAAAASRTELAQWTQKANARRQQAKDEAADIRRDYKGKADQLSLDTETQIKFHEDTEVRENQAEDTRYTRDIAELAHIRDDAKQKIGDPNSPTSVIGVFNAKCKQELDAYDDYVQTQTAVIQTNVANELKQADADLEEDYKGKFEAVKTDVANKLATFQTKLDGATQRDVAALTKELGDLQKDINTQVQTVASRSLSRAASYAKAADQKVADIQQRAQTAVTSIKREARIATLAIDHAHMQSDASRANLMKTAQTRADASYERQRAVSFAANFNNLDTVSTPEGRQQIDGIIQDGKQAISTANNWDLYSGSKSFYEAKESDELLQLRGESKQRETDIAKEANDLHITRRELKTGNGEVNANNADAKRTDVLAALQPSNIEAVNEVSSRDPAKAIGILSQLTREELLAMYPEGPARDALMQAARTAHVEALVHLMLTGRADNPEWESWRGLSPQAIAMKYALQNKNKQLAMSVLDTMTTDKERANLEKEVGGPIRNELGAFSEQDRRELETTIDSGRSFDKTSGSYADRTDGSDLVTQWNQDKARREAIETTAAYSGADPNKLLQLRSEMLKRHSGPFLDDEDRKKHEAELRRELEEFGATVENVSGKSMSSQDEKVTAPKVREALLATSENTYVTPDDQLEDIKRPRGDWDRFGVLLMERSIEKNNYDPKLAEKFVGQIPPEKREYYLKLYAEKNGATWQEQINSQVRTSSATTKTNDGPSYRNAKVGDVESISPTQVTTPSSEIDADSLISIADTGKVPDELRLVQLTNGRGRGDDEDKSEYSTKLSKVTSDEGGPEGANKRLDTYEQLRAKYKLGTTGDAQKDLSTDTSRLYDGSPSKLRENQYLINTAGQTRNLEWDKQRLDAVYGDRDNISSVRRELEGPAGEELDRSRRRVDEQYQKAKNAGLTELTPEQIDQMLNAGAIKPEDAKTAADFKESSKVMADATSTVDENYKANVVASVTLAATVVGTTVTAGLPVGPVAAAIIGSVVAGTVTVGGKAALLGDAYSSKERTNDIVAAGVDAVMQWAGPKVITKFVEKAIGRFGKNFATQLLTEMLSNTTTATVSEVAKIMADPDTFVGNSDQVLSRALARVKKAAVNASVTSVVQTSITKGAKTSIGVSDTTNIGYVPSTAIAATSNVAGTVASQATSSRGWADLERQVIGGPIGQYNEQPWSGGEIVNAVIQGLKPTEERENRNGESLRVTPDAEQTPSEQPTGTPEEVSRQADTWLAAGRKNRETQSKREEVGAIKEVFARGGKVVARETVDSQGRRVYDVETGTGEKYVLRGPREEVTTTRREQVATTEEPKQLTSSSSTEDPATVRMPQKQEQPLGPGMERLNGSVAQEVLGNTRGDDRATLQQSMLDVYSMVRTKEPAEIVSNPQALDALIRYHLAMRAESVREGAVMRKVITRESYEQYVQGINYKGDPVDVATVAGFVGDARNTQDSTSGELIDTLGLDYDKSTYVNKTKQNPNDASDFALRPNEMVFVLDMPLDSQGAEDLGQRSKLPLAKVLVDAIAQRAANGDAQAAKLLPDLTVQDRTGTQDPYTAYGTPASGPRLSNQRENLTLGQERMIAGADAMKLKPGTRISAKTKSGAEILLYTYRVDATGKGHFEVNSKLPPGLRALALRARSQRRLPN